MRGEAPAELDVLAAEGEAGVEDAPVEQERPLAGASPAPECRVVEHLSRPEPTVGEELLSHLRHVAHQREVPDRRVEVRVAQHRDVRVREPAVRLEMPYASLQELGAAVNPPMSKSAVNHRLKLLHQAYEERGGPVELEPVSGHSVSAAQAEASS